ncbi:flagellar biosynthetic protein FliP [Thalassococcus profundi]|uniref:Flagellar biosynthetic protein FliP n=1 Tax=Thalassococcus profundi TaxID=2282382 RepID=A0A369TJH3_9RHOB|nr:flagellar type III secretion system pore protein FliP [Thalassococcus profundi]RDD65418.1 flagellar biosynthetic protein FliP [Thalassococcus profundi]
MSLTETPALRRGFARPAVLAGTLLLLSAAAASAQDGGGFLGTLSDLVGDAAPGTDENASLSGRIVQFIALVTVLSIAPGLLVVMTSFTRFVIVLSMLRSALGLNQTPPNIVLTSLALFMTFFVMQPVFEDAYEGGVVPLLENTLSEEQAIQRIADPFRAFMFVNTRPEDYALFLDLSRTDAAAEETPLPEDASEASFRHLVPAFMISELRRAFTIGFLIYLPFVAIDLIVASVLMSAGMMMLPPVMISLPFKVIFFVLIDGWYMLAGSLIESYAPLAGG